MMIRNEESPLWVFPRIRRIHREVPQTDELHPNLPLNLREGILFVLRATEEGLRPTTLMKLIDISHLIFRIPVELKLAIWHYGPSDRLFYLHLRLLELEGYVARKDGRFTLTHDGRNFVEEEMLPWSHWQEYCTFLRRISRERVGFLAHYSEYLAGMILENRRDTFCIRVGNLEDFSDSSLLSKPRKEIDNPRIALLSNTTFFAANDAARMFGLPKAWPDANDMCASSDPLEVSDLVSLMNKNPPSHVGATLYERKNSVFSKINYLHTIYLLNHCNGDHRWVPLDALRVIVYDTRLRALLERRFSRNLPSDKRRALMEESRVGSETLKDVRPLVRQGILEEKRIDGKPHFWVGSREFADKRRCVYLPDPKVVEEDFASLFGFSERSSERGEWLILRAAARERKDLMKSYDHGRGASYG